MINRIFFLVLFITLVRITNASADSQINLTPLPKDIQVMTGSLVLPDAFQVCVSGLPDSLRHEARIFTKQLRHTTGIRIRLSKNKNVLMRLIYKKVSLNPEAYHLKISSEGICLEASTTAGFFYGFQTLKKLLPPHVMAGVVDAGVNEYALPLVDIMDEPRFGYRGFMLDVARHFFPVEDVKRILDMMACYKMNKLHLHLSDDQGFRIEVDKYPKLTEIGSVRAYSYSTDFGATGKRLKSDTEYGPFYYSKKDIRELVAYAAERHIDIIPEIDMPGHFAAALAAYPEYSCTPEQKHPVLCDESHTPSILNVVNPGALQFAKDILDELMSQFPYPYIHIGGDECTTQHWEQNSECQDFMKKMGFKHYRQLQSYFTKEMAEHVRKNGYRLLVWNETITAEGSDLNLIKGTDVQVICWTGAEKAARKAAALGLDNILAPQPTYYINRLQSAGKDEPAGPGNGRETLETVYNYDPASNVPVEDLSFYKGIQACMWTEYISKPEHLEYMAFPRLIAVAEAAWSPSEKKNFPDFLERMKKDTVLFDYNHYTYGRHYLNSK